MPRTNKCVSAFILAMTTEYIPHLNPFHTWMAGNEGTFAMMYAERRSLDRDDIVSHHEPQGGGGVLI